jgi:hypothetical protein
MFNELAKFVTPQRLFILLVFVILAWLLYSYSSDKSIMMDGMETGSSYNADAANGASATHLSPSADGPVSGPAPAPSPTAAPSDLLPADQHSQWAALNPVNMSQGNIVAGDMLQAGYHIGLDTIGQTMKNANLQLRSDPIIPKQNVGPWNQSTYEPDYARVPLEIGSGSP